MGGARALEKSDGLFIFVEDFDVGVVPACDGRVDRDEGHSSGEAVCNRIAPCVILGIELDLAGLLGVVGLAGRAEARAALDRLKLAV